MNELNFEVGEKFLREHPKRMSKADKENARLFLLDNARENGYDATVVGNKSTQNVVVGNLQQAKHIFTAHYDTPPAMPRYFVKHQIIFSFLMYLPILALIFLLYYFLSGTEYLLLGVAVSVLILSFPLLYTTGYCGNANKSNVNDNSSGCITVMMLMERLKASPLKEDVAFIFFDNEEKGLLGSKYINATEMSALEGKRLINFDCVGNGEALCFLGKRKDIKEEMFALFEKNENRPLPNIKANTMLLMSDERSFTKNESVGVMTVFVKDWEKGKVYTQDIHSKYDTFLNEEFLIYITDTMEKMLQEKTN